MLTHLHFKHLHFKRSRIISTALLVMMVLSVLQFYMISAAFGSMTMPASMNMSSHEDDTVETMNMNNAGLLKQCRIANKNKALLKS